MNAINELNENQQKVFDLIKYYKRLHGEIPSLNYIHKAMGYNNKSSAQHQVNTLKSKGVLEFLDEPNDFIRIPLVGNVSCGPAILAEENIEAYIPISSSTLKQKNAKYFFLRADGDSMNESDINPGDFVLIRQQPTARLREVVVAIIGDDATLKELGQTRDGIPMLMPRSTNPKHKPLILPEGFSVLGVKERVLSPPFKEVNTM